MVRERLRPMIAAVSSVYRPRPGPDQSGRSEHLPFITISRQAGAGGNTVMQSLITELQRLDGANPQWTGYDRELIDKVAHDHHVDPQRIKQLEDETPSWLLDVLEGLQYNDTEPDPTDRQVYHMVTDTMRDLARRGRVVLMGLGGAQATSDLPEGIHVRLVAPGEHRIANLARLRNISQDQAREDIRHLDRARKHFYKRFWHIDDLVSDAFDLTLNTGRMSEAEIVEAILPMVRTLDHRG